MEFQYVDFGCVEVEQPIGRFYLGAIEATDLLLISYADIRRLEKRDLDLYLGIQRPLNESRVRELMAYVKNADATFPTSVILAVDGAYATFDAEESRMRIQRRADVARIIDGQHRIAGLEGFEGSFQIPIVVFIDMELEDQAMVFSTINLKQARVSKSLAFDLFELATKRSPQKTAHAVTRVLNRLNTSPLHGRIKILGRATGLDTERLTQAAVVDQLLPLISDDPREDRDRILRGKPIGDYGTGAKGKCIFRDFFIAGEDEAIARVIIDYFSAVAERWPEAWDTDERGMMLGRTNGFLGLMRFFLQAYKHLFGLHQTVPTRQDFARLLAMSKLTSADFNTDRFKPGTSGQADLARELSLETGLSENVRD